MSQLRIWTGLADDRSSTEQKRALSPCLRERISSTFSPPRKLSTTTLQIVGEERPSSSRSSDFELTIKANESRWSSTNGRTIRASLAHTNTRMLPREPLQMRVGGFDARSYEGVKSMIESSLKGSSRLQSLQHQLGDSELVNDTLDMRVTHVREIPSAEDDASVNYRDQLLFICGCLSLARDFQEYQRRCDSRQREQKIDGNIPILAGTAAGHHDQQLPDFVASQAPVGQRERADLEAAVLFGIKVRVVDAIGNSLNLGKGLGLLCAFERQSILSLPTKALPHIRKILMDDPLTANRIWAFSAAIGPWWNAQCEQYQERYSSVAGDLPRRSLEAWNTTSPATITTRKISFTPEPDDTLSPPMSQPAVVSTTATKDFAVTRKPVSSPSLEAMSKKSPTVREITQTFETSSASQQSSPSLASLETIKPWPSVKELTETIGDSLTSEELPLPSGSSLLPPSYAPPPPPPPPSVAPDTLTGRSTPSPIPPCPELVQSSPSAPSTRCSSRTSTRASRSSSRSPNCSPILEDSASECGFSPVSASDCGFSPMSTSNPGFSPITDVDADSPATERDIASPTATDCSTDAEFSPVIPVTPQQSIPRRRSVLRTEDPIMFQHRRQGLLVSRYTVETLKAGSEEHAHHAPVSDTPPIQSSTITASPSAMTNDPFVEQNPFDSDFCLTRPSSRLSNRSPIVQSSSTPRPCTPSPSCSNLLSPTDNTRAQTPVLLSPTTYSRTPSRCATPTFTSVSRSTPSPTPSRSQPQAPAIPIESKPVYVPTVRAPRPPPKDRAPRLRPSTSHSTLHSTSSQTTIKPTLKSCMSSGSLHSRHSRARSSSTPTLVTPPLPLSSKPSPTRAPTRPATSQGPSPTPTGPPSQHIINQFLHFTDPRTWVSDAATNRPYRLPISKNILLARTAHATAGLQGLHDIHTQVHRTAHAGVEVEAQIDELLTGLQRQMADVEASRLLGRERKGGVKNGAGCGLSPVVSRMGLGGMGVGGFGLEAVKEEMDCGQGTDGVRVVEWGCY